MKTPPAPQPLIDDGVIDEVLHSLKSGKEATVYVVRAANYTRQKVEEAKLLAAVAGDVAAGKSASRAALTQQDLAPAFPGALANP